MSATGLACHRAAPAARRRPLLKSSDDGPAPHVDPELAARTRIGLLQATSLDDAAVRHLLGAYTLHAHQMLHVERGTDARDLIDDQLYEVTAAGDFHAVHRNAAGDGLELYGIGRTIYARPGFGAFTSHRAEVGEPAHRRNEAIAMLGAAVGLVGRFVEVSDGGTAVVGGRPTRVVLLALDPHPGEPPVESSTDRAWRETIAVSALSGRVSLDGATGVPLAADLDVRYTFKGSSDPSSAMPASAELRLETHLDPGGPESLTAPADATPRYTARRYQAERNALLEGLAGKGAQP